MAKTIPTSLLGRVITHRSRPGHDLTIRGEPVWYEYEGLPRNHAVGPPSTESLTPQEQIFRHEGEIMGYTPEPTPPVPLNLGRKNRAKHFTAQPPG